MSHRSLIFCALAAAIASAPLSAAGPGETQAAQSSNVAGVKITVVPEGFPRDATTWDFAVTLETHTQDLDDNLVESATLLADGTPHRPLGWEGSPPGGHHRKGILRFTSVTPLPPAVELQIRRKAEPAPRVFRWQTAP